MSLYQWFAKGITEMTITKSKINHSTVLVAAVCCRRVSIRPSVRPSVTSRYCIETTGFWHGVFLPPISHCVVRKFGYTVSPKVRVLPSGILSQTPDLENFATASRFRCQQNSSSSSTVEFVDDTYTTTDKSCRGCLLQVDQL